MRRYDSFVMRTAGPSAILALLAVLSALLKRAGSKAAGIANAFEQLQGIFLFLAFPSVSSTTFEVYNCLDFDAGNMSVPVWHRRLAGDMSLDCNSPTHASFELYAAFMLMLWPLGVPLLYAGILYAVRADPLYRISGRNRLGKATNLIRNIHRQVFSFKRLSHFEGVEKKEAAATHFDLGVVDVHACPKDARLCLQGG